jgi:hypothetical protein
MLGYMKIVSKVTMLESDMKESEVMSDLMVDFPPISKQDPPEVLAAYVYQHYQDTGYVIAYSQIPPTLSNVSLKIAGKRKSKKDKSDDEEKTEEKPKKAKKTKKAKVSEPATPNIQEEVANLEPINVLEKRKRGGSSKAASQPKKKA